MVAENLVDLVSTPIASLTMFIVAIAIIALVLVKIAIDRDPGPFEWWSVAIAMRCMFIGGGILGYFIGYSQGELNCQ